MDEKQMDGFGNVCTIVSGIFLGLALVDKISKTPISEIQKLASGEVLEEIKMLPDKQEEKHHGEDKKPEHHEHEAKHKANEDKIAELQKEIAKYKGEKDEPEKEE